MTNAFVTADPMLHLVAAVLYAVAFVALTAHVGLGKRTGTAVTVAGGLGLAVHVAGIAVRWVAVGHGPYVTQYENLSSYAFVVGALALYIALRRPALSGLRLALYPVAFLLVGFGLYSGPEVANLPPTFSGIWLVLHVCFYFLAFGTAVTAVGASVLMMVEHHLSPSVTGRLPAADQLDSVSYQYAGLAFAFWGIGMLTGAIWAFNAWGRYWGWDPVETWSLVTWLLFGVYLHLRRFYRWEGRRAAWLLIVCFGLALMSLFGTTLITNSLHSVYFK